MITKLPKHFSIPNLTNTLCYSATASKPIAYYYKILNLKPGFTSQQLKSSYLEMVKKYHPDLSKEKNAKQMFMEVQTAYDILQDQTKIKSEEKFEKNVRKQFNSQNQKQYDQQNAAKSFHERFNERYKRKENVQQNMQFSYNLYKKHYEKMQQKKMQYKKYPGSNSDREIWARKDEKGQPIWGTLGLGALMVGLAGGAIYVVNLK